MIAYSDSRLPGFSQHHRFTRRASASRQLAASLPDTTARLDFTPESSMVVATFTRTVTATPATGMPLRVSKPAMPVIEYAYRRNSRRQLANTCYEDAIMPRR